MQEATIVERLRNRSSVHTVVNATEESASLIERQQQVIDLLMKAVEPFADRFIRIEELPSSPREYLDMLPVDQQQASYDDWDLSDFGTDLKVGDLRRAREAKVEAEKLRLLAQCFVLFLMDECRTKPPQ